MTGKNDPLIDALCIARYDYVDVFDGLVANDDRRVGRYCHPESAGVDLAVNGSSALVRFRTDNYAATGGFKLRYQTGERREKNAPKVCGVHSRFVCET